MVSCDQEGMSQEEEDIPLTEGFQWESLLIGHANMAPTRQRSLSESSVAPESSLFPGLEERAARKSQLRPSRRSSPTTISTLTPTPFTALAPTLTATPADWEVKVKQQPEEEEEETDLQNEARPQTDLQEPVGVPQAPDSMVGYSSLSTEPSEAPGSGKKRRAAGVSCGRASPCLIHMGDKGRVVNMGVVPQTSCLFHFLFLGRAIP